MKWEEIYEQTKHAFQNGEMIDLLTGKGCYGLSVPMAPVSVPTDWTSVISQGVFELFEKEKDARLIADYEDAIRTLINGSAAEVWMAANIVAYQLLSESEGKAAFGIDRNLVNELSAAVHRNKEALASDRSYQGAGNECGLLDDILRLNGIVLEDCNVEMIKDSRA